MLKNVLVISILLFSLFLNAEINENPMSVLNSFLSKQQINANEEVELKINVFLAKDHHAYSKQFKVLPENEDIKIRTLLLNPEIEFYDNLAKKNKKGMKDKATLTTSFEVPESLMPGEQTLNFKLQYQACTKDYCLMPIDLPFKINTIIVNPNYKEKTKSSLSDFDPAQTNKSFVIILLTIFLAGFLTSFTPCVYPMIPITLAILGNSKNEKSFSKKLFLSLNYVFGIAITYSLLGVIAASTGGLFGSYVNHPLVRIGIGVMFVLMSLSMFGVFEIQVPKFIRNRLANKKFKQNYFGAFLTGIVAGIIASPCVGPVLISILAYVASSGNIYLGFIYLFTFAMGLGVIFIFIGLFSHLLDKLPRSGNWMDGVKFIFGSVLLAAAAYYLMPLLKTPNSYIFPIVVSLIAIYFAKKLLVNKAIKTTVILLLSISIACISSLFIPNVHSKFNNMFNSYGPHSPNWVPYSESIYTRAKQEGKGLIIDFYADWCEACKELEAKTFSKEAVAKLSENFIWVKYDATNIPDDYKKISKKYNIKGLPHITFYNEKGKYIKEQTLFGFEDEEKFIERLNKVINQ